MSTQWVRRSLAALSCFLLVPAAPAGADDLIVIPVSGFARGSEGDVVSIASVDVPADIVGATCQITGRTVNQVSVHEGNDLLIITNGQTFVVLDFEDAGFIEHEAGEVTAVGSTIELQIRFGPDGLSSGGFRVSVDCEPEATPTTTIAEPTTTTEAPPAGPTTEAPATTVPVTEAATSVVAASTPTSAEEPPAGLTTIAPETTTTAPPTTAETTAPPSTSASTTSESTTTAAAPTSEEPPAGPEANDDATLPVTGSNTHVLAGFGLVLIAGGLALRRYAAIAA